METSDCTSSWGKYFFGIYFVPRIGIAVWNELTNCRWRWRKKMQVRTPELIFLLFMYLISSIHLDPLFIYLQNRKIQIPSRMASRFLQSQGKINIQKTSRWILARTSKCEKWSWKYYRRGFEKNQWQINFASGSWYYYNKRIKKFYLATYLPKYHLGRTNEVITVRKYKAWRMRIFYLSCM